MEGRPGYLLLEDGTRFDGRLCGAEAQALGEVVFTTGMSGYQESMTDPSFAGQLITFTYPHIGNYGVSARAMESERVWARAAIMREACNREDAPTAERGWLDWLADCGVPAISELDTRSLVQHIRRADVARSYSTSEIEVGIVDTKASPYFYGITPTEIQLVTPAYIESYRQAEKEGYHAVVPLGMLDLGVDGGKSAVDIPVVGPMESSLHIASLLGDRFGLIIYHEKLLAFNRAIVRRYGMEDRIVGFGVSGFDLPDITANREKVVENFLEEGKKLVAQGAEVIIPMGITQCPVHIKPDFVQEQLGVPVVEGIGAPIRVAAMLASLGLRQSRVRWPKSRN